MKRINCSILSLAIGLASCPVGAAETRLPPSPVQSALKDVVANGPDNDSRVVASDLLRALQAATPSGPVTVPPRPDAEFSLRAGMSRELEMRIGEIRTISLPTPIDKTFVVLSDVADVVVLGTNKVQVIAKAIGTTDLVVTAVNGESFKVRLTVTVSPNSAQQSLNSALPLEHFTVIAANGALILRGSTRDAEAAAMAMSIIRRFVADEKNAVNQIQILGGQQVMISVRVSEVNRTLLKQLGISSAINNNPGTGISQIFGNNPNLASYGRNAPVGVGIAATTNTLGGVQPFLAIAGAANPVAFISSKAFGHVFTSVANALESQGLARTLAEPNLVTMTGKTASLNAGTDFPIPTVSQLGRIGTEYHKFGVSLGFTPTVMSNNAINLDIVTEVSTKGDNVSFPDGAGGSYLTPSFNTRKEATTVELPSGGSIVIGGLISNDMQTTMAGIPGVKDIPFLGRLFSSSDFQRHETELVISVTAYIVQPTDANKLSEPTTGLTPPSDTDLYLFNRLTGLSHRRLSSPPSGIEKAFGFIME